MSGFHRIVDCALTSPRITFCYRLLVSFSRSPRIHAVGKDAIMGDDHPGWALLEGRYGITINRDFSQSIVTDACSK